MEAALAFPALLLVALIVLQFAVYVHAQNVVIASCTDGARVASEADRGVGDGVAAAQALLQAGLGRSAGGVAVQGTDGGDVVVIEARGSAPLVLGLGGITLPVHGRAVMTKERWNGQ